MKSYKPGEIAPKSGEYKIVGLRGAVHGSVSVKKGDKLPPTQVASQRYEIN